MRTIHAQQAQVQCRFMTRPSNDDLIQQFRHLLTKGFIYNETTADELNVTKEELLEITKPFRQALWKDFNALARRLSHKEELLHKEKQNGTK